MKRALATVNDTVSSLEERRRVMIKLIKRKTKRPLKRFLKSVFKNHVYVAKQGLSKGFKITGDLGLLGKSTLTPHELCFLMSLDLAGKTVIDVGSHIGIFTLYFSKAVGETGKVISFEPNPETFAILCKNVEMNGLSNVSPVNLGLGEKRDTLLLVYGEHNGAVGTMHKAIQEQLPNKYWGIKLKTCTVQVHPLDEYILTNSLPDPDFVKIDVEGYEYNVLLGMQDTIRRCKPSLYVEVHAPDQRQLLENVRRVVKLLSSHEYKTREMTSGRTITENNIDQFTRPRGLFCN
jgi:FkbM family methyltransferase